MTLEDEERREAVELHRKDKDRNWPWVWATVILFLILAVLFAYPTSPPTAG